MNLAGKHQWSAVFLALCAGMLLLGTLRAAETNAVPDSAGVQALKLAAQKDPQAQYRLGQLYASGSGVPQNYEVAAQWFKRAAGEKNADAQYSLGFCYATGAGVTRSLSKAASLYLDAAKQGHAEAQFKMAVCYEKGLGVLRASPGEAAKWYGKAAEQGVAAAQTVLGNNARLGLRYTEAVKWYNLAAVRGVASAQYWLAIFYRNGQGVERKDLVEAYKWFSLAAENGYELAGQQMDELPKLYGMTPEQVAMGKQKAREVQDQLHPPGL